MKKNLTINLFGALYAIDEDAYQLLERYLENMKSYFAKKEGGEEIADDIEHRVAEHLWDLKEQGMEAIDIETIKDIITRIGNPEEIVDEENGSDMESQEQAHADDNDKESETSSQSYAGRFMTWIRGRGLYRDAQDKLVGGVASGFSHFFGLFSPLPWRILFIVLAICTQGFFVVVYVVLWIITPLAKTAEQRLHMKGKEITPQNINEEIINGMDTDKQATVTAKGAVRTAGGCLSTVVSGVVKLLKIVLLIVAISFLMFVVFVFVPLCVFTYDISEAARWFDDQSIEYAVCKCPQIVTYAWIMAVCALVVTLIPVMVIVRWMRTTDKPLSTGTVVTVIIAWCVSLAIGIGACVGFCASMDTTMREYRGIEDVKYVESNTRDGIYLYDYSWRFIEGNNMKLLAFENGEPDLTGESYRHPLRLDREYLRLVQDDTSKRFISHAEMEQSADAGDHVLEALVWNSGDNHMYIVPQDADTLFVDMDIDDATLTDSVQINGRKLADITWEQSRTEPMLAQVTDSAIWEQCRQENGQWRYVKRNFHHHGGTIKVGIKVGSQNEICSEGGKTYLGVCVKVRGK